MIRRHKKQSGRRPRSSAGRARNIVPKPTKQHHYASCQ
jgi:hypothetical protein